WGQAKIMDFGIARSLETDATKTGTLIGTPAYMSPEQAEGKPPDGRSDIYSLGLILYEMFTGQRAFHAETPIGLAMKQIQEAPRPPREVEPDLPERLDRAIQRCLEKNPKKRFQSTRDLAVDLAQLRRESGEPHPVAGATGLGVEEGEPALLGRLFSAWGLTPRRWWELDTLAGLIVFYPLMIYFAWKVKEWTQEPWAFFSILVYVVAPFSLRVFLLATAAFNPAALPREVRRLAPWLMFAHGLVLVGLVVIASMMEASHTGFATLLVGFVVAGAVAVLIIHPAINRAAFPEVGATETAAVPGLTECRRMGWIQAIYLVPFGFLMLFVPASIAEVIGRTRRVDELVIVPASIAEVIGRTEALVGMVVFWVVVLAFGILMGRSMLALWEGNRESVGVFYRWFPLFFLADLLAVALIVGLLAGMRMLVAGLFVLPVLLYLPFYQRQLARKLLGK
ncbi:MAG: protein kinase, partial [Terriglobia bacterium]